MKFLLAVSINHQELKGKIVLHLGEIGEHFKIIDSYVRLFPEADMVEHVCAVYDNYTQFLQLSIDWCKENTLGTYLYRFSMIALTSMTSVKFFKNVALPYEARIKPTIDDLNKHMRKVKERVEVHNTHRLAVMQVDISALIGILNDERKLQVDSHASIFHLLQSIASDQKKGTSQPLGSITKDAYARIKDQLAVTSTRPKEGSSTFLQALPNLQHTFEHLKDCTIQSVQLKADHSYAALDLPNKPQVRDWLRSNESALLWIDGFAHSRSGKWTTEFSVDVLLGAERQRSTVLFYFGDIATSDLAEPSSDYLTSPKAILHSFIVQVLHQHAHLAQTEASWQRPEHWTEARRSTKAGWKFLHSVLQSLSAEASMVYLIVDSIDTLSPFNDRAESLRTFLRHLSALVTSPPSSASPGSGASFTIKILLTSVTGNMHSLLFPPTAASSPSSHFIVHIPQTFGQHNVAPVPGHLRKPGAKRLVRLPDSDDEFGLKPADSFGFFDDEDEDLTFSSEEDTKDGRNGNGREKEAGRGIYAQKTTAQNSPRNVNRTPARSTSGSSEELCFSENETDSALRGKRGTNDIEFSSSDEA